MTSIKNLLVAALGVSISGVAFAQAPAASAPADENGGLLGKRYVSADFGYEDINNVERGVGLLGATVNLPVLAHVDLQAGYDYAWIENNDSFYQNSVDVNAVGYLTMGKLRPFASAGLGYVWLGSGDDDFAVWQTTAGLELSLTKSTAIRAFAAYSEGFEDDVDGEFAGVAGVNHWFSESFGANVGVTFYEAGDVAYGANLIFQF